MILVFCLFNLIIQASIKTEIESEKIQNLRFKNKINVPSKYNQSILICYEQTAIYKHLVIITSLYFSKYRNNPMIFRASEMMCKYFYDCKDEHIYFLANLSFFTFDLKNLKEEYKGRHMNQEMIYNRFLFRMINRQRPFGLNSLKHTILVWKNII